MITSVRLTSRGLYCDAGKFFIDPHASTSRTVLTHPLRAHPSHEHKHLLCHTDTSCLLPYQLKDQRLPNARALPYDQTLDVHDATISLHPAGYMLGSSQLLIRAHGHITLVLSDLNLHHDPTCAPYQPITSCDTLLVSGASLGLPIYTLPDPEHVLSDIMRWWDHNRSHNAPSLLATPPLGMAQRLLSCLTSHTQRPVFLHDDLIAPSSYMRDLGVPMLPFASIQSALSDNPRKRARDLRGALVLAPPDACDTAWIEQTFGHSYPATALVSAYARASSYARQRGFQRAFPLDSRADWTALLHVASQTQAQHILIHEPDEAIAHTLATTLRSRGLLATALTASNS